MPGSVGVSRRGGHAPAESAWLGWDMPHCVAARDVSGKYQSRAGGIALARKTGHSLVAASANADFLHWADLVGQAAVGLCRSRKITTDS